MQAEAAAQAAQKKAEEERELAVKNDKAAQERALYEEKQRVKEDQEYEKLMARQRERDDSGIAEYMQVKSEEGLDVELTADSFDNNAGDKADAFDDY
jgi:hypothetical protein